MAAYASKTNTKTAKAWTLTESQVEAEGEMKTIEDVLTPEAAASLRKAITKMVRRVTHCINDSDFDDLCSAAFVGAVSAIERFDISHGVKLQSFLMRRARGAVLDELRQWDILPRSMRFRVQVLDRTEEKLRLKLGRYPTELEIASEMDISEIELERLRSYSRLGGVMESLDSPVPGEEDLTLSEILADERTPYASETRFELHDWVRREVHNLKHAYRFVIFEYYWNDMTGARIGKKLGVTESRVCQIHKESLRQLGARLIKCGLQNELSN